MKEYLYHAAGISGHQVLYLVLDWEKSLLVNLTQPSPPPIWPVAPGAWIVCAIRGRLGLAGRYLEAADSGPLPAVHRPSVCAGQVRPALSSCIQAAWVSDVAVTAMHGSEDWLWQPSSLLALAAGQSSGCGGWPILWQQQPHVCLMCWPANHMAALATHVPGASYGCQGGQTFPCPGWPYMCLVWWPLWLANHLALAAISMHRVLAAAAMSMPNMVAVAAI